MISDLIRVLIVEDQPNIQNDIKLLLAQQKGFTVSGRCGSVKEAKILIAASKPDLLLLDIQLVDGTAFDLLKELPTNDYKIIFLTAFEQHAIRAIKYGALDYLLKPIDENEFSAALKKVSDHFPLKPEQLTIARQFHSAGSSKRLVLRFQDYLQVVDLSEIVFCQSDAGYTSFFLSNSKKFLTSKVLKEYEDILTEPRFIRPHQSYLVNVDYIDRYNKDGIIHLKNGVQIPVATRKKESVLEFFNRL